jgi:hypothetical protein
MTKLDIDDIVFLKSIQDPFSDGNELVSRLRQAEGRRFTISDDGGLLKIKGRREVWAGKANVAYMLPMTAARAEQLGDKPGKGDK